MNNELILAYANEIKKDKKSLILMILLIVCVVLSIGCAIATSVTNKQIADMKSAYKAETTTTRETEEEEEASEEDNNVVSQVNTALNDYYGFDISSYYIRLNDLLSLIEYDNSESYEKLRYEILPEYMSLELIDKYFPEEMKMEDGDETISYIDATHSYMKFQSTDVIILSDGHSFIATNTYVTSHSSNLTVSFSGHIDDNVITIEQIDGDTNLSLK